MLGTRYAVALTFVEPILGTAPRNKELYTDYIASKAPPSTDTSDEEESLEPEKIGTGFHRVDGPVPVGRHIRGVAHVREQAQGQLLVHRVVLGQQDAQRVAPRQVRVEGGPGLHPAGHVERLHANATSAATTVHRPVCFHA